METRYNVNLLLYDGRVLIPPWALLEISDSSAFDFGAHFRTQAALLGHGVMPPPTCARSALRAGAIGTFLGLIFFHDGSSHLCSQLFVATLCICIYILIYSFDYETPG